MTATLMTLAGASRCRTTWRNHVSRNFSNEIDLPFGEPLLMKLTSYISCGCGAARCERAVSVFSFEIVLHYYYAFRLYVFSNSSRNILYSGLDFTGLLA